MKIENESLRQKKVSRQLQRDLGEIFQQDAAQFSAGRMVTVTQVRISPDLEYARIYLSIFPSTNSQEILESIRSKGGEIRFLLGKRVRHQLRVVPELTFDLDDSLDYIENIDRLLRDE